MVIASFFKALLEWLNVAVGQVLKKNLEVDNSGMVVDDGLVPGADVVAVLKDAAQDESGNVVNAQSQGRLGKGFENAKYGLVDDAVGAGNQLFDQFPAVDGGSLVALGERDICFGYGILQVLEQEIGEALGCLGKSYKAHHEGVLVAVIGDGLADLGPIPCQDSVDDGGNAVGEHFASILAEIRIGGQAAERTGMNIHFAVTWIAGGNAPLAGVTDGCSGGDFDHGTVLTAELADVADVQVPRENDVNAGLDEALAE